VNRSGAISQRHRARSRVDHVSTRCISRVRSKRTPATLARRSDGPPGQSSGSPSVVNDAPDHGSGARQRRIRGSGTSARRRLRLPLYPTNVVESGGLCKRQLTTSNSTQIESTIHRASPAVAAGALSRDTNRSSRDAERMVRSLPSSRARVARKRPPLRQPWNLVIVDHDIGARTGAIATIRSSPRCRRRNRSGCDGEDACQCATVIALFGRHPRLEGHRIFVESKDAIRSALEERSRGSPHHSIQPPARSGTGRRRSDPLCLGEGTSDAACSRTRLAS